MTTDNKAPAATARAGWIPCPGCGNPRLKRVHPDESAACVYVYCRRCKREIQLTLGAITEAKL